MARRGSCAFTVTELVVVMAFATVLSLIAVSNLQEFNNPLQNGASQMASFIKQVRSEAISTTRAYFLQPSSSSRLITLYGDNCADPSPTTDTGFLLNLPSGAYLTDTTWSICFNSRGFPDANIELGLQDQGGEQKTIEILLGGAVRIQ